MCEQLSIFDVMQSGMDVPTVNEKGYIPAEALVPIKWEHWKYSDSTMTLRGGEPYVIDAALAILPGNRLYVKDWMMYPFMYEFDTSCAVSKEYFAIRKRIVERKKNDNDTRKTWQVDELPTLRDMWKCEERRYSCEEYAHKTLYGYHS